LTTRRSYWKSFEVGKTADGWQPFRPTSKTQAFAQLFAGQSDPRHHPEGWCISRRATLNDYRRHLEGIVSLGVCPLADDGLASFAVVDIDDPDRNLAMDLRDYLLTFNMQSWIEMTEVRRHRVWLFFSEAVAAAQAGSVLMYAAERSGLDMALGTPAAIIPNPDRPDSANGQLRDYVNLPYFGVRGYGRVILDPDDDYTPLQLESFLECVQSALISAHELNTVTEQEGLATAFCQTGMSIGNPRITTFLGVF